ncbi:MAG TPA: helix-turn-helix domain-containing protein [Cyclobacteriaceae bacterium]|nr:helix-turn-helix domain-containing protein [Cyclobacteriaceae bacterium]
MEFSRIEPPKELKHLVECYWTVTNTDPAPFLQKIIPDGFPEIIFHFGDPYKIELKRDWEIQAKSLVAGQITSYFFLENTGCADILGIKLKPAAIAQLFGTDMSSLKDKVISLNDFRNNELASLDQFIRKTEDKAERIRIIKDQLLRISIQENPIEKAIECIFSSNGMLPIASICDQCEITERQLERLFKKFIGLSPKFYTRIIRFNYIFQVSQGKKLNWAEVGIESGFYDQAHFIKNFKAFSGEDPSRYFFDELNLANFFLKKV